MKLHQSTKTIRVRGLDGKMTQRTIFEYKGAKVSVNAKDQAAHNTAHNAFKNYLNKPSHAQTSNKTS